MEQVVLISNVTCPDCGHESAHNMPENACQYFMECPNCEALLKPLAGDCCVFCSYGTAPCPPVQRGRECGRPEDQAH
ncbi:GDCCVxC domain-containing (seleno)protein [Shimia haliotis]|uniref:GDCCVxC domain-containing (seleno)protein n=1 Tax=Shimia haliotis TaxID=1280847 RepID=UPI000B89C4E9|nr:GDCCVxC domain-containing (seleno)protein [Shimia haliotis]